MKIIPPGQVIHCELDGFLGSDAHQLWDKPPVQAGEAFVTDHLAQSRNVIQ